MELRELQNRLTEILFTIDDFCKENGIPYYLEGGTALGAVRHKGFIPWDDDIDICMDIKDYEKFCNLFIQAPPKGLALQIHRTDHNYINGYGKVRDLNTLTKEDRINIDYKYKGLFVDVFPYEEVNPLLMRISHLCFHRVLFWMASKKWKKYGLGFIILNVLFYISVFFDSICRLLTKVLPSTYSYTYGCNAYAHMNQMNKNLFLPARYIEFEGRKLPVANKIEIILTNFYGDYMRIPPIGERPHPHFNDTIVLQSHSNKSERTMQKNI